MHNIFFAKTLYVIYLVVLWTSNAHFLYMSVRYRRNLGFILTMQLIRKKLKCIVSRFIFTWYFFFCENPFHDILSSEFAMKGVHIILRLYVTNETFLGFINSQCNRFAKKLKCTVNHFIFAWSFLMQKSSPWYISEFYQFAMKIFHVCQYVTD